MDTLLTFFSCSEKTRWDPVLFHQQRAQSSSLSCGKPLQAPLQGIGVGLSDIILFSGGYPSLGSSSDIQSCLQSVGSHRVLWFGSKSADICHGDILLCSCRKLKLKMEAFVRKEMSQCFIIQAHWYSHFTHWEHLSGSIFLFTAGRVGWLTGPWEFITKKIKRVN